MNGDRDIRELLQAKASEMPPSTRIPTVVLKRSKRRRALTASAVSLALVVAGAAALAGVRAVTERPRLDPVRPAPTETDPSPDRSALEDTDFREFGVTEMISVTIGQLPDRGGPYVLRVGRSSTGFCAELLPEGTGACDRGPLLPPGRPLFLYAQGASSGNDYQHFYGATNSRVTDIEVRWKGEVVDAVRTQPAPSELETRVRFFVALAPQRATGTIVALDRAGRPAGRVGYDRMRVSGPVSCDAGRPERKLRDGGESSGDPAWWTLIRPLEPTGMIGAYFAALVTGTSAACSESVEVTAPRKARKADR